MLKNLKGKIPRVDQALGGAHGLVELIASMASAIDRIASDGTVDVTWRDGHPVISVAAGYVNALLRRMTPRTFDVELSSSSAKIVRCWYLRGPVWKTREEEPELSLSGTEVTLCARINLATGEVSLTDEPDLVLPGASDYFVAPLFVLRRADEEEGSDWYVAVDLRPGCLVVYV